MKFSSACASIPLISLYAVPVSCYWRMACSVSQTSRIDPILNPGTISGHVHKFAGGNNVDQFSTQGSLLASTCSTCEVQDDKSAYWTPQLYYEHADGTIEEVQNDGMTVYYVGRGGDSSNTVPFPDGFKMISGNSLLRHYDEQSLTYLDTRPIADRETHYLDRTDCVNGLRAQLNFQSCWDGVNLYSPGNTHVAYLSGIDYGVCPPSHPVPIPGIFFEVLYWTNRINQSGGGRFVFSNGDTTGFGFHGDFLNGWDQDVQQRAVQQCLYVDNGGTVSACPALASSVNENFARICPEPPQAIAEAAKGILPEKHLPGCNPITSGPADAPQVVCPVNSSTPAVSQTTIQTPLPSTPNTSFVTLTTSATPQQSATSILTTFNPSDLLPSTTFPFSFSTATVTTVTSIISISTPSFSTRFRSFTRQPSRGQSSGGVFVTVPTNTTTSTSMYSTVTVSDTTTITTTTTNSSTTSSIDPSQPLVPTLTSSTSVDNTESLIITIPVTASSLASLSLSPGDLCSSFFGSDASFYCQTFEATDPATSATTTVYPATETQTTFVTVYSPVTVNVTSITDVTVAATTTPLRKRYEGPRRLKPRAEEIAEK